MNLKPSSSLRSMFLAHPVLSICYIYPNQINCIFLWYIYSKTLLRDTLVKCSAINGQLSWFVGENLPNEAFDLTIWHSKKEYIIDANVINVFEYIYRGTYFLLIHFF